MFPSLSAVRPVTRTPLEKSVCDLEIKLYRQQFGFEMWQLEVTVMIILKSHHKIEFHYL